MPEFLGKRHALAHGAAGINSALEAGVDSIEHGSFLDSLACSSPKALFITDDDCRRHRVGDGAG